RSKDHAMAAFYAGQDVRRSRQPRYTTIRDSTSLGVARGTIRRYVEPAIAAGFVPGGTPPLSQADWEPLVK
ncbi:hypothetical protein, partial [Actinoplanes sp. NPDC051851]|uniref:hypothetical protein n=1 Tax=Actinoplanes sp. NPDC051851 TaxID=3154753 RepID=UPI0034192E51